MQTGDLAYVPSGAFLYKMDSGIPTSLVKLEEPMSIIICGQEDKFYKVIYQGSIWHTTKNTTTLLQRGEDDNKTSRNFRNNRP